MIGRRSLLLAGAGTLAGAAAASASVLEARFDFAIQRYEVRVPGWGARPPLTICAIADLHAGEPWMPLDRVAAIVAAANAVRPDLHVILGDLPAHHRFVTRAVPMAAVAEVLAGLRAPLGRVAILGNHDWWDDPRYPSRSPLPLAQLGRPALHGILERAGIPVLANRSVWVGHGAGVWLAGVDSGWVFRRAGRMVGPQDLAAALAGTEGEVPVVLLAHEPDVFPDVPPRVGLTLCGHTHGGQVRVLGQSLSVPSRYGRRYAYGRIVERGRFLVVSGGLGCSVAPVRLGVPPELTVVRVV